MKDKSTNRELYVSEISFDAKEEDLLKLFALCGTVRSIHLVTDKKSALFRGSAFIRMASAAEAKDAIVTLDGTRLLDRCISVVAARPKETAASPTATATGKSKQAKPQRPRR